jgi:hypothetical protein
MDPRQYEGWSCREPGDATDGRVRRDAEGKVEFTWQRGVEPLDAQGERRLVASGQLAPAEVRFLPWDVETGKEVLLHRGTVRWNAFRQRWVTIATEAGGTSPLGEVWYVESRELMGPWRKARKIVTHDRYSFYNPVHHACFDQEGGRRIYFEGTYANTFSGNADATPRYDYNQVMYRLDLGEARLAGARVE